MFTFILANLFRCYSLLAADYWKSTINFCILGCALFSHAGAAQRRERYISSKSFPSSRASPVGRCCVDHFLAVLSRWEFLILEFAGKQR